ncbi:MAG: hypothetical protein JWM57_2501 [Phycisphaerales bacterium]|nr:hypothetical protein [Phycisphaerales bacterium]
MSTYPMPAIVSRDEWERSRADLLAREKAHMQAGDQIAAARRRLPMTPVDPVSVQGPAGVTPLHQLFEGRSMLLVYFFMWNAGKPHAKQCEGCTFNQAAVNEATRGYLAARDVSYAVFSVGPLEELLAYRDFMGWTTPWYSIAQSGPILKTRDGGDLRCYLRDGEQVYQTYDLTMRGTESTLPALQFLDLMPFGRQETWEDSPPGTPQVKAGSWWRQNGRPIAQWTRTSEPAPPK